MKTRVITLFTLSFFYYGTNAQLPTWVWARQAGGAFDDRCAHSAIDANQNVLLTGYYSEQTLVFGSDTLHNFDPYSGTSDIFVAKYDSAGNVLWANSAGSNGGDEGFGICADARGNIYVTGSFDGIHGAFGTDTFTTHGVADIFVAKYDPNGHYLWVRQAGSNNEDVGQGIAVDANGNVYVAGYYSGPTLTFGSINLSGGKYFLAKYDSSGNVLWARQNGGSPVGVEVTGICTDGFGNIYTTGYFEGSMITFGSDTFTLYSPSYEGIFITKYDSAGNLKWAKQAGKTGFSFSQGISTDMNGNLLVTGIFDDTAIFGSDTLTFPSTDNAFLVKYDSTGNVLWTWDAPDAVAEQVATDRTGNIYFFGGFDGASIMFGTDTFAGNGSFIAELNPNGNPLWIINGLGGAADISPDPSGEQIYFGGYYYSSSFILGIDTLTNAQSGDTANIFAAKLKQNSIATYAEKTIQGGFDVRIFPNPMYDETTLYSPNNLSDATLTIYNVYGQQVKQLNHISGNRITVSRDNLSAGVYLYRLTEANTVAATGKLVVIDN